ncbi:MAG TPA: hypothetical protein VLW06_15110 [Terriglobales bacterium]|nr:hypothetical protein [Terriglobales bacterium]
MPRHRSQPKASAAPNAVALSVKPRKRIPYEFVLDALASSSPWTRPLFGCTAIYVGEKIVLCLREKPTYQRDNGVWLATTEDHHESLRLEFPNMRSVGLFEKEVTGWQVLPVDAPDFESAALRACKLITASDHRIGKIPGQKRKPSRTTTSPETKKTTTSRKARK